MPSYRGSLCGEGRASRGRVSLGALSANQSVGLCSPVLATTLRPGWCVPYPWETGSHSLKASVRDLAPLPPRASASVRDGPGDPEPVDLEVLRTLRDLCANFRVPPRQFRRRVGEKAATGYYSPDADTVAVDPDRADSDGMGE